MDESTRSSRSSSSVLHLAGIKETEGERVLRALQKLSDKIQKLENEHKLARNKVESLGTQTVYGTSISGDFYRRLAKTEARCKLLEQQLCHVRKVVKETTLLNIDDLHSYNSRSDLQRSLSPSVSRDGDSVSSQISVASFRNLQTGKESRPRLSLPTVPSILDVPIFYNYQASVNSSHSQALSQASSVQKSRKDGGEHSESSVIQIHKMSRSSPPSHQPTQSSSAESLHKTRNCVPSTGIPGSHEGSQRMACDDNRRSRERRRASRGDCSVAGGRESFPGQFPLLQNSGGSGRKVSLDCHYHVSLGQMPFCSAATTGKSHSLSSNLQSLLSMVKTCHPALCTAAPYHRLRSLSGDRQRLQPHRTIVTHNMARWNSTSDLEGSRTTTTARGRGRSRSLSIDNLSGRRPVQPKTRAALDDLDLVPVKLKPSRDKTHQRALENSLCETPGNICLRSEVKELPVAGSNRVLQLKVTTGNNPNRHSFQSSKTDNRRKLLKNVREIQYMVENDQC